MRMLDAENNSTPRESGSTNKATKPFGIEKLARNENKDLLCPIHYIYNPFPAGVKWLQPQNIGLPPEIMKAMYKDDILSQGKGTANSFPLNVKATALSMPTGFNSYRQNKHWEANAKASEELLELFAQDRYFQEAKLGNGKSIASWAHTQLQMGAAEAVSKFSIYMYPDADIDRIQLLAQAMILVFVMDEVLEVVANESKTAIQEGLLALVEPRKTRFKALSPLQRRATEIRQGFLAVEGGAGEQVLQQLVLFCCRDNPWKFGSLRDYMNYRDKDIASEFIIAGAKFSIGSRVAHHDPRMKRFTELLSDQIAACNDIFSYDKERRAFMDAESDVLINLVTQIENTYGIQPEHAKSVAYAFQLSVESELAREIAKLHAHGLALEEWKFINACLHTASGNAFTSVVISRYGGKQAKI